MFYLPSHSMSGSSLDAGVRYITENIFSVIKRVESSGPPAVRGWQAATLAHIECARVDTNSVVTVAGLQRSILETDYLDTV